MSEKVISEIFEDILFKKHKCPFCGCVKEPLIFELIKVIEGLINA